MDHKKILFFATEMKGVLSLGGLGEVVAALALTLKRSGHDVRIVMPGYSCLYNKLLSLHNEVWRGHLNLGSLPDAVVDKFFVQHRNEKIPIYMIKGHPWFESADSVDHIYAPESNPEPYFFLSAALIRFLQETGAAWCPDIIHCHDYHTALLPVYLKTLFDGKIHGKKIATVFTIHNLGFQGITHKKLLTHVGLPDTLAKYSEDLDGMEYYEKINCMKGGLCYSDLVSTVSKTYAEEIQTPAYGHGLEGLLSVLNKEDRLQGILNGIDQEAWDPEKLEAHLAYSILNLEKKQKAKQALQKTFGLEESNDPVIAIRSRWTHQKGIELLLFAFRHHHIFQDAQFVVFTNTTPYDHYSKYWYEIKGWANMYPKRIAFYHGHEQNKLLQNAGSDMLLMPSLYEPCGITHMEAMRFGTIPVVRRTGGLADSVNPQVGFTFDWEYREPLDKKQKIEGTRCMVNKIHQAIDTYRDKSTWTRLMRNAMEQTNDWKHRINFYCQLYENAVHPISVPMHSSLIN